MNTRIMTNIQTKDAMNTKITMKRQTLGTRQVDEHEDCDDHWKHDEQKD